MSLEVTYLNERVELFDAVYGEKLSRVLAAAASLHNRLIGPVTSIHLVRPELPDLSMHSAYCQHAPLERLIQDLHVKARPGGGPVPGGGKGASMLRPVLGALGEMIERLLGMLEFTRLADDIQYGTWAEMVRDGRRALGPGELPLFADRQYDSPGFDFRRFREDSWLGWVEGRHLLTGEPIWVPAQLVLLYYRPRAGEPQIGYATTAGLAFQLSPAAALLHGLCEVVERDALNLRWYSWLTPRRVVVDLDQVMVRELDLPCPRMSTPNLDVGVFELTLDSPFPVLAAIAADRARTDRAFLGGTGGAFRREEALAQALFELGQCQTGFHFEDPFGRNPILPTSDLSDVIEFFDAPLYYGYAANLHRTSWFSAGPTSMAWEDVPTLDDRNEEAALGQAVAWLRKSDFTPVVFDWGSASPPGTYITKIYIPELSHACPPGNPMLGHPRFYRLPEELGLADRRLSFDDLNPDPIPFA